MVAFTTEDIIKLWENEDIVSFWYVVAQMNRDEVSQLIQEVRKFGVNDLVSMLVEWDKNRTTFEDIIK
ncbi:MAG: hypothetical protein J6Y42_02100 [Bacilli bacterium]|nr:hypothetical protein [Bacilli bacterium]